MATAPAPAAALLPGDGGASSAMNNGSGFPARGDGFTSSWTWGLWSPSDAAWYDRLQALREAGPPLRSAEGLDAPAAPAAKLPRIPRLLHQIWLGERPVPERCKELMDGWRAHHPSWEYRLWTDAEAAAELEDFATSTPGGRRVADLAAAASNPAERSDILRLVLVLRHGGLYVDVDFECLGSFEALHEDFSFYTGLSNVAAFELNNGLFAASAGHPLLAFLVEHVGRRWPEWGGEHVDSGEAVAYQLEKSGMLGMPGLLTPQGKAAFLASTGPGFFTRAVMVGVQKIQGKNAPSDVVTEAGPVAIFPPEVFYPLPNSERGLDREKRSGFASPSSLAIHHWFRTWGDLEGIPDDG
eukprot:TRINITY_DN21353_c3_g2_i1.p1 TRINITY_DN21353_c3_g2~~TRINITY_DN21353_c3_g2_i1.p1  ORF type:complete len:355 (-),score=61.56 TRINITY_DN21353_c3_g2_i1:43-1107(-)